MPDVIVELTELNKAFATAERTGDAGFFETHLADGLQFRRASGKVVDKSRFLADLRAPGNTNERVEARDIEVLAYGADLAACSLLVDFKGTRDGRPSEGMVRNTRVFVRGEGLWKCALWLNTNDVRSKEQEGRKP
jgi:hypothetical protein